MIKKVYQVYCYFHEDADDDAEVVVEFAASGQGVAVAAASVLAW